MEIQLMLFWALNCWLMYSLVLPFAYFRMVLLNIYMQLKRRSRNLTSHKEVISAILIWIALFCFRLYKVMPNNVYCQRPPRQAYYEQKVLGQMNSLLPIVSGSHMSSLTKLINYTGTKWWSFNHSSPIILSSFRVYRTRLGKLQIGIEDKQVEQTVHWHDITWHENMITLSDIFSKESVISKNAEKKSLDPKGDQNLFSL